MRNTVNKNYRAEFAFGNNLEYKRYCKNFVQITINGHAFTITLVPEFQDRSIPMPPFGPDLKFLGKKLSPADRTKLKVFQDSKIIFAERTEMKDQFVKIDYEFESILGLHVGYNLAYCLDSQTYNWIRKDLKKHFLYINSNSLHGDWKREEIIHFPSMEFIDRKLHELVDVLPPCVKKSLEL